MSDNKMDSAIPRATIKIPLPKGVRPPAPASKGELVLRRSMKHLRGTYASHTPNSWHLWTGYFHITDPGVLDAYKVLKNLVLDLESNSI